MGILRLVIFIIVFLILGFVFYKLKPREFTDNSKFILNILFEELDSIYAQLEVGKISQFERQALLIRKDEILYVLEQFFGKNLEEQQNEFV